MGREMQKQKDGNVWKLRHQLVLRYLFCSSLWLCLAPCGSPGFAAGGLPVPACLLHSGCWWAAGTDPGKTAARRTVYEPRSLYLPGEAWCLDRREQTVICRRKTTCYHFLLLKSASKHWAWKSCNTTVLLINASCVYTNLSLIWLSDNIQYRQDKGFKIKVSNILHGPVTKYHHKNMINI